MAYPYSRSETVADGAVHVAGLALAIPASILLLIEAAGSYRMTTAAALYAGCMVFAFIASAIYHLSPVDRTRPLLNRIDHAAIYFKIAGTYTPFVALIGSGFAYGVLGIVWALALVGAVAKMWFWGTDGRGSLALYLVMGWLAVLLFWPMWQVLPPAALFLVATGGSSTLPVPGSLPSPSSGSRSRSGTVSCSAPQPVSLPPWPLLCK